ncbi:MAG: NAD(P)/FAD-dependent oxidoreductase [Thermoplasmata archaeon]|nr:NAD(P)/FAD-dependent oxidoreductase [Thermoplasmata archaeon]
MADVDVLVVGAGPAGTTAAYELARRGHSVRVVEEHPRVGRPVQCAGLVSSRVLELAGSRQMVLQPVHGATVFAPSLQSISFLAKEARAFVIDRAGLDIYLADRASNAGAEFQLRTQFEGATTAGPDAVSVRLVTDGVRSTVTARVVIGADGVTSAVARAFRLRRPVEILPAFEAEFARAPGDPDTVEVYLGRKFAPGLFAWWIPDGTGGARVGLAALADGTPARVYFDRLVETLQRRFSQPLTAPTGYLVSGIPIGRVPRYVGDHVVLVGDAAAQVKPLSGGGIFTGMRAGTLAAETIHAALQAGRTDAAAFAPYPVHFDAEFGDEFSKALTLRRVFLRLNDDDLERVVDALKASGTTETIVAFGDIDFPTPLARRLILQSPSLLRLVPKAFRGWLGSGALRAPELDPDPRRNAT